MKKCIKKSLKASNGITLIALVITIIVLLILAGISISMLSGDNSILQKATDSKTNTERASVIEQTKTEILGQIADNKGETITETQLKTILNKYFEEFDDELPDDLSETTITLTAKESYGGYSNIALVDIYNGKLKKEVIIVTPTDVYAALYNDGTLVLSNNSDDIDSSKVVRNLGNLRTTPPQHVDGGYVSYQVTKVNILNKIVPTSCEYWFKDFYNLTEIVNIQNLDTSLVTNMEYMFATCERLIADVSSFNTGNVTNMQGMFANGMNDDFSGAGKVTGFENFDMSNVTNMQGMFYDAQLNDAQKLVPVLTMCINATKISNENKTLNYLSLGSYRAGICQTLSNYENFLNAGWTIGY